MAVNPMISFKNDNIEFKEADSKYGSPSIKYTTHIQQNNPKFPLQVYELNINYSVFDKDGIEVAKFTGQGTVQNGVLSISDVTTLYGLKSRINLESLSVKVKDFIWYPNVLIKPYEITDTNLTKKSS